MPLDASLYYLVRASNGTSVLARRGDGTPKIISGGARYSVVNRPRRKGVVQWDGDDPYRMDVPVLLDGWIDGVSVENDVAKLNQMYQSTSDLTPPVTIFIDGALPIHGAKWVIESIDEGDLTIWQSDNFGSGYRLRQDMVLHLLQFVTEIALSVNKSSTGGTPYTVRVGDTLASIAANNNSTVTKLKQANSIRDQKSIVVGQKLTIPFSIDHIR